MTERFQSFEEFWPFYVSQHRDRTSRRLHFVGTTLAMGCVAAAPFYPPALLAAPVCGYGFAWAGHYIFEKNKPATFRGRKEILWSLRGDFRMWMKMATGAMDAEIDRLAVTHAAETEAFERAYALA